MRNAISWVGAWVASVAAVAASTAPPSVALSDEHDARLHGRVVDEALAPVAAARVVVQQQLDDGTIIEHAATADADGRFTVPFRASESSSGAFRGYVLARTDDRTDEHTDERAGLMACWYPQELRLKGARFELSAPLVLKPAQAGSFEVVDGAGPVAGARVEFIEREGYPLVRGVTEGDGKVTLAPLPLGSYRVVAHHALRGSVSRDVQLLAGPTAPLRLALEPVRDLMVTVIDFDTHRPIAGAELLVDQVQLPESGAAVEKRVRRIVAPRAERTTGADGTLLLRALPTELPLRLDAVANGLDSGWNDETLPERRGMHGRAANRATTRLVAPDASNITLEMKRQVRRLLRFELDPEQSATPAEGTALQVVTWRALSTPPPWRPLLPQDESLPTSAVVHAGGIELAVIEVNGEASLDRGGCIPDPPLWAVAPDGALAVLTEYSGSPHRPERTTRFERSVPLTIELRDQQGRPVEGEAVSVSRLDQEARERNAALGVHSVTDADGRLRFAALPIGRYGVVGPGVARAIVLPFAGDRVVLTTRAVTVERPPVIPWRLDGPAERAARVELPVCWVAPPGESLDFAEAWATEEFAQFSQIPIRYGEPVDANAWPAANERAEETEWLRTELLAWRRGTPPTLAIRHPYLIPAARNAALDLSLPRSLVTLHLELGPLLSFTPRIDGAAAPGRGAWIRCVPADATEAERRGAPVRRALRRGDAMVIAPLPAGRWHLSIEIPDRAAVELPAIELTGDSQELGAIDFPRGSTVTVTLAPPAGFVAPPATIRAERLDGFPYVRLARTDGEACRLPALSAGRWRIVVTPSLYGSGVEWSSEVTVDGVRDAEVTIAAD